MGRRGRGYGGGGRGRVYTYRYTVTTRMTCIKRGSDESRFNVSLTVRDKVTRPCPQTTTCEEKGEPKRYRTEILSLTKEEEATRNCVKVEVDVLGSPSLIVLNTVSKTLSNIEEEENQEPKLGIEPTSSAYQRNALPLGQTGCAQRTKKRYYPSLEILQPPRTFYQVTGICVTASVAVQRLSKERSSHRGGVEGWGGGGDNLWPLLGDGEESKGKGLGSFSPAQWANTRTRLPVCLFPLINALLIPSPPSTPPPPHRLPVPLPATLGPAPCSRV